MNGMTECRVEALKAAVAYHKGISMGGSESVVDSAEKFAKFIIGEELDTRKPAQQKTGGRPATSKGKS